MCLPWLVLRGTTSTRVVPFIFRRQIRNDPGFRHRNKPAQRVPWHFLLKKKYKFVFLDLYDRSCNGRYDVSQKKVQNC
jgi:hypothetical protein